MRHLTMAMAVAVAVAVAAAGGCLRVKVDPVEVKPITLNVNLRVDRELDDFFAFEKELGPATAPATTRPTPTTSEVHP